jgi:hypothetical protein
LVQVVKAEQVLLNLVVKLLQVVVIHPLTSLLV